MRKDYALLDQKIKAAYVDYIKQNKEIPTEDYIAGVCGTSQTTVSKHLAKTNLDDIIPTFKIFGNNVLMGLMTRASKGDAQAAKLFFALVFDYKEKSEHEITTPVELTIKVRYEDKDEDKAKGD